MLLPTPIPIDTDENEELEVDDAPHLGSPIQIFQYSLKKDFPQKNRALVRAYWQLLHFSAAKNKKNPTPLQFTYPDQLHFNFGIWCGEQFSSDPDVQEFLEDHDETEDGSPWPIILEECQGEFDDWSIQSPFFTITSWLESREKIYQQYSDTENFEIPSDVLRQMPEGTSKFLDLRAKRKSILRGIKTFMLKCPGSNEKLVHLASEGILLDQLDFLLAKKGKSALEEQKTKEVQQIWLGLSGKLKTHFDQKNIMRSIELIEALSNKIRQLISQNKLNLTKAVSLAKEVYRNPESSNKRLARDINILKNNINIGSVKSTKNPHLPIISSWPRPIETDDLSNLRLKCLKCLKLDRSCRSDTQFLLAPGAFKGFYEFDRSTVVLPLYSEDIVVSFAEAMADRHLILETLKSDSTFLTDLQELAGEQKTTVYFFDLYERWFKNGLKDASGCLSDSEIHFVLTHIAPSIEHLFLRDEQARLEQREVYNMVNLLKLKKLSPKLYPLLACSFSQKGHFKEALRLMKDLHQMNPERYDIAISVAYILQKMDQKELSKTILKNFEEVKNQGYYGLAYQSIL
jgi:hypothetical protein